jgi:hypothetical protein
LELAKDNIKELSDAKDNIKELSDFILLRD